MSEEKPRKKESTQLSVGVDLGGTNMRIAVYGDLLTTPGEAPEPVVRRRREVGDERSPEAIVARLADNITEMLDEAGCDQAVVPVGIGIAAMLRGHEGVVAISPHLRWRDVAFGSAMRARLGDTFRVLVANDVDAITWGEYRLGAGAGVSDVLAVFVGTGIGAGIVANGALVTGSTHAAAEIGHVKVVYGDRAAPCACGLRGCVEAYAGGSYLQRRARAELAGGARSAAVGLAGGPERVNPGHLDAAAAEGDEYALSLYAEVAPLLGVVLANALTLLDPARLILGGGVLSRTPVFREHVVAALEVAANPPALDGLVIADAALGDDAGLLGSALLAAEDAER